MNEPEIAREFKTAPVGRRVRCRITPNGAEIENAKSGRRIRLCEFSTVERARFSEIGLLYAGTKTNMCSRRLKLVGAGHRFTLAQNGGTLAPRTKLDLRPYLESCIAVLRGLDRAHPGLPIDIGMSPRTRWMFFLVGLLPLTLGALLLLGVALIDSSDNQAELMTMGVMGFGFFVYGLAMVATTHPWRARQRMTAIELAQALEARLSET